jgi:uncharacterized membrane protein
MRTARATGEAVEPARRRDDSIDPAERWLSVAGGAGLLLWGLARRSPVGVGAAVVGAGLAYRGARGRSHVYRALGIRSVPKGIEVRQAVTIQRPPEDVYHFWRDLTNLPRFMRHLESVERVAGQARSRWVARGPAGRRVTWEAELVEDQPPRRLAWRTVPGADVEHEGRVDFEPARGGRETVVRVRLAYRAPAGKMGALVARLLGAEPAQQVAQDLRRLAQVLEAGEIPTTAGQPSCRAGDTRREESRP